MAISVKDDIKNILLVEDNPDHAELALSALQCFSRDHEQKFQINVVRTGEECISAMARNMYDVVVIDYSLPMTNGLEVIEKIREKGIKTPAVMVTGRGSEKIAIEAMKKGISEYLVKDHDYLERLPIIVYHSLKQFEERQEKERLEEELKKYQIELEMSKRLASIGEMASKIAHEIKNPLSKIRLGIDLLKKSLQGIDKHSLQILDSIQDGVKNLNRIALDLLNYARPSVPTFRTLDIHGIIDSSLNDLSDQLRSANIRVIKRYHKGSAVLNVEGVKLKEVFLNLIGNAIDAMPERGSLTVKTGWVERGGRNLIKITFSDTGEGIPQENLEKAFAPFFTTKPTGTGLGLSIVKKVMDIHGGFVELQSEVGNGTTVALFIPKVENS